MNIRLHLMPAPESSGPTRTSTAFVFRRLGGHAPWHLPGIIFARIRRLEGIPALGSSVLLALTAAKAVAASVIVNGDFSAGYTGFETDYVVDRLEWVTIPGEYAIGRNPQDHNTNFVSIGDHTTGDGNMMVVNGATAANRHVWFQDFIPVTPNTVYNISFWAASAHPDNPATLKIQIDHADYGDPVTLSTTAGQWEKYSFTWKSPMFGSRMALGIFDTNLTAHGNDFVIDDISMIPEPSICMSMVLGCGLVLRRRR